MDKGLATAIFIAMMLAFPFHFFILCLVRDKELDKKIEEDLQNMRGDSDD